MPRTICLLPEFQRTSVLKANAVKMLLTFGQPKFRLFLLCEGNGDGTGVHFLEYRKHRGYRLEESVADGLIKECVDTLRFTLKVSTSLWRFALAICTYSCLSHLTNIQVEAYSNLKPSSISCTLCGIIPGDISHRLRL